MYTVPDLSIPIPCRNFKIDLPAILGHEIAGEVVEVGSRVTKFKPGDRVTVEVSPEMKYQVEVRAIEKGGDDASLDISAY